MKNNLGKIVQSVLIFFNLSVLNAQGFTTEAVLNKQSAYIKEPVVLTFDIKQTDNTKVMFFDFTLAENKAYEFYRIGVKQEGTYQKAQVHYTYLIYPLQRGEITIDFELIQKTTTKQDVAYSFSGDRDNVKDMTTKNVPIKIDPLKLQVKPLPEHTQLVGDFTLSYNIKKHDAEAYEPLPFTIEIKGEGYLPKLDEIVKPSKNYTLFKEEPNVNSIKKDKKMYHTVTYVFAFSTDKSFALPSIRLKAFNPITEKSYTLDIPKQNFTILPQTKEKLTDKTDFPMPLHRTDWSWLGTLLGYGIVFLAGLLTAKSVQWYKKDKGKSNTFTQNIAQTNDPKVLIRLLIAEDSKKYAHIIEKLDAHIYGDKPLNIKEVKKELNA